ncbi:hypothetical protein [Ramlibacter sp.]|uniref:hypothetical protein n=1 Tax=Ramlibacter sp. TaxID=1917967 RepID=UPI002C5BEAF2|nr:hypothetical protein [Ramlibacter sp.]HWI83836.1 hypothetical protein [Ramlibacter sp.]
MDPLQTADSATTSPSSSALPVRDAQSTEVRPIATSPPQLTSEHMAQIFELARAVGSVLTHPEFLRGVHSIVDQVKEFFAKVRPAVAALGSVAMFLGDVMLRIPVELRASVLELANRGWFFDPNMPLPSMWQTKTLIETGKGDEADAVMATHFEDRLDEIEAQLSAALPARVRMFKSGFAAHRRGEYNLSILMFMAQADGVCAELRGGHFFLKDRNGKPQPAAYAEGFAGNFMDEIAHLALFEDLPIRDRMARWLAGGATGLNRHGVMHGESLDYDTRENSLRAISLLNYVALALNLGEGTALDTAAKTPLASIAKIAAQSALERKTPTE